MSEQGVGDNGNGGAHGDGGPQQGGGAQGEPQQGGGAQVEPQQGGGPTGHIMTSNVVRRNHRVEHRVSLSFKIIKVMTMTISLCCRWSCSWKTKTRLTGNHVWQKD